MLSTRLWMGSVLIALVVGMLVFDQFTHGYPFQLIFQLLLAVFSFRELKALLGAGRSIHVLLALGGVLALNVAPWYALVDPALPTLHLVFGLTVALQLGIFLAELRVFSEPGQSFERMARTWWVIAYLGLLPSFFAQIRWLFPWGSPLGSGALALAIFVPKGCDIGAYFTGRAFGRHPMTPVLSPKKTWEGAAGGLVFAVLVAIGIDRLGSAPVLHGNWLLEIGFGLTVGLAGMLGDLAESLIKRDCQRKDASQTVPGFGGVLDVVDAVIFAAPLAYLWLRMS
jgi:phosphatidate cytidylyltransferase